VYKHIIIGVISTGNEVVDITKSVNLNESQIYDSNKPMITALLNEESFMVRDLGILKDDPEEMFCSISKIIRESDIDVLITSGGVSMGDRDFVKEIFHKLGATIHVEKTNLKPGKPMVVSTFRDKVIFSLAGNPVSSITAMILFVIPFLKNDYSLNAFIATTLEPIQPDSSRVEYSRGILEYSKENNRFYVRRSDSNQMSSNIQSIVNSNSFIIVNPGKEIIPKGSTIEVLLNGKIKEHNRILQIGVLTMSDRASSGIYDDKSGNEIIKFIEEYIDSEYQINYKLIPDEKHLIEKELINLVDSLECNFVITTGGTGPSKRDNTVEITEKVCHKMLPGFGEVMRAKNFDKVPTTILSSQTAGIRYINDSIGSLIVNLPGSPKSIRECLEVIINSFPICSKIIGSPLVKLKQNTQY
jgi:molybdenum cofactor synthesis domain-containing protein